MEVTWSKCSTQAGPYRVTCEDHVQAALGHLQAQKLYNLCANTGACLVLTLPVVEKQRPVQFGDSPVVTLMESVFSALTYHLTPGRQIVAEVVLT